MTSLDLVRELQSSRPVAPAPLRARVRETAAGEGMSRVRPRFRLPAQRSGLVALPVAAALALGVATAAVIGIARSGPAQKTVTPAVPPKSAAGGGQSATANAGREAAGSAVLTPSAPTPTGITPTPGRAQQVAAMLTIQVPDSNRVSEDAQQVLDVTRSLGGHVVDASVATGENATASLTVRVPTSSVQEAIVRLSALGKIVSQQVTIEDLQESLDALTHRAASVRNQIAHITALLESGYLDPVKRASLEARRNNLRTELRSLRRRITAMDAEARMATIQMTIATPSALGIVTTPSRIDRTLSTALVVLVWEGIVALAVLLVAAPLGFLALAVWLVRRAARKREEERLLTAS